MIDVVLRGGVVVDGSGGEPRRADVAVADGRIAGVGEFAGHHAATTVDCAGRYVLPGFIDAHSHADAAVFSSDVALALLRQGVTTVVAGQDGVSYAPGDGGYATDYFAVINGGHPSYGGTTVAELLAAYDGATPVNVAYLVPHGTVRYQVMGLDERPPTDVELSQMVELVAAGLADGAVGLSSGLDYVPGKFADAAELAAVCRPVAEAGALYVTHMRGGYERNAAVGVAEVRQIAATTGVACHISHYHGPAPLLVDLVDQARAAGCDLTFDAYPYLRGCSLLAMVMLPDSLNALGPTEAARRLADPETRAELMDQWFASLPERLGRGPDWAEMITLTHVAAPEYEWGAGLSLASAARRIGVRPEEFVVDVLAVARLAVGAVFAFPSATTETDVRALLRHDVHLAGSDGIYVGRHPHPRGWGTFARYLARHTVELGDYSWPEVARHLSGRTAARFGLTDRGQIRTGYAADLAVIDPERVAERASYEHPRVVADGVDHVVVNGVLALRDGQLTGANPGAGLRRGQ